MLWCNVLCFLHFTPSQKSKTDINWKYPDALMKYKQVYEWNGVQWSEYKNKMHLKYSLLFCHIFLFEFLLTVFFFVIFFLFSNNFHLPFLFNSIHIYKSKSRWTYRMVWAPIIIRTQIFNFVLRKCCLRVTD